MDNIQNGKATVVSVEAEEKGGKVIKPAGWAIPGGYFTTDRAVAERAAAVMAGLMK